MSARVTHQKLLTTKKSQNQLRAICALLPRLTIILCHHSLLRNLAQLYLDVHDTNIFGTRIDIDEPRVDGLSKRVVNTTAGVDFGNVPCRIVRIVRSSRPSLARPSCKDWGTAGDISKPVA